MNEVVKGEKHIPVKIVFVKNRNKSQDYLILVSTDISLSEEEIISPMVQNPTELIAMNKPSLIKFEPMMVSGGVLLVNSSIIEIKAARTDISAYYIPCQEIADGLGNRKTAIMVMLGAYIEATKLLKFSTIQEMLAHLFTGPKAALVELNVEALRRGANCVSAEAAK